jgi:hypothetical protein
VADLRIPSKVTSKEITRQSTTKARFLSEAIKKCSLKKVKVRRFRPESPIT